MAAPPPRADVARQISDLWNRALGAVEATGLRVDPALTPLEQARAVAPRLPVAARPLKSLAAVATAATFAPPDEVAELVAPQTPASRARAGGAARSSASPPTR